MDLLFRDLVQLLSSTNGTKIKYFVHKLSKLSIFSGLLGVAVVRRWNVNPQQLSLIRPYVKCCEIIKFNQNFVFQICHLLSKFSETRRRTLGCVGYTCYVPQCCFEGFLHCSVRQRRKHFPIKNLMLSVCSCCVQPSNISVIDFIGCICKTLTHFPSYIAYHFMREKRLLFSIPSLFSRKKARNSLTSRRKSWQQELNSLLNIFPIERVCR